MDKRLHFTGTHLPKSSFTQIIIEYLELPYNVGQRHQIYLSCKVDSWLETEKKLHRAFEEYLDDIEMPTFLKRLIIASYNEVDWLQIAIKLYKMEGGK